MHLDIESVCVLYAGGIVERTVLATRMVRSHSLPHSLFRSLISHFKLNEYFRPLCSILLIVLDIFSSLLSFSSPSSLRSQVQALNFKHLRLKGKCWCDRSCRIFVKIQTNRYCSHRKMYILRHTAAGTHECSEQEHGTSTHNTFIPWRKSITLRTSSVMLWYFNGVDSLCTHQQKKWLLFFILPTLAINSHWKSADEKETETTTTKFYYFPNGIMWTKNVKTQILFRKRSSLFPYLHLFIKCLNWIRYIRCLGQSVSVEPWTITKLLCTSSRCAQFKLMRNLFHNLMNASRTETN